MFCVVRGCVVGGRWLADGGRLVDGLCVWCACKVHVYTELSVVGGWRVVGGGPVGRWLMCVVWYVCGVHSRCWCVDCGGGLVVGGG